MKERRQIVNLWRSGGASVLITLVRAEGSSYRRTGARLLLNSLRNSAGTISGGCLEAEMIRKAPWLVQYGAQVERISTQFDDTAELPFGLGCGGTIDLLLEPTETPECRALLSAMERSLDGLAATVLTWLPDGSSPLARAIVDADGDIVFSSPDLSEAKTMQARAFAAGSLSTVAANVFAERLESPQRLMVVGAGDDAKPLVTMAALLGWDVLVIDGRAHLATGERFPESRQVAVGEPGIAALPAIQRDDAVVIMTHSYEQDRDALRALLPLRPRYIGLLGARHRSSLLLSEVSASLGLSVAECCERVCAPIGLDLGGDGPEAIALAVIAEVQACCMGKLSGSLRLSAQDVETYLRERIPPAFRMSPCALELA